MGTYIFCQLFRSVKYKYDNPCTSPFARREFGKFIENYKYSEGKTGNANFTWKELIEIAKEFFGE